MGLSLNLRNVLFGEDPTGAAEIRPKQRSTVSEVVRFAYGFFFRRFWTLLRLVWFPFFLAGFLLYQCFSGYLAQLLLYLSAPNPHAASLGLGWLAAGVLMPLFCYAVAIAAISGLMLEGTDKGTLVHFQAQRREWRLYAAYLRFLLIVAVAIGLIAFSSIFALSRLDIPRPLGIWVPVVLGFAAVYWLVARVAFFIVPLAAEKQGPILRSAWKSSGSDILRISGLIFILLVPGVVVQILGEYVLRKLMAAPAVTGNPPLVDYAHFVGQFLLGFLVVAGLSSFITVTLLTAGAIAYYRSQERAGSPLHAM